MPCECTDNKKLNKNILSLEIMRNMSIDEIINLYRQGYKLEDSYRYVSQDIFGLQMMTSLATNAYPNIKEATARWNGSSTIPMILYGNSGSYGYVHLEAYVAPSTMISEIRECANVMTTLWKLAVFPAVSGLVNDIMFRAKACDTLATETCTTCTNENQVSSWPNGVYPGTNITTPPAAPTGLIVTPGNSSLTLSWNGVGDPTGLAEVFAYKVTVSPGGISGYRGVGTSGRTVTIPGLTNGVSYSISVKSLSHNNVESSGAATGSGTPTVPLTLDSIEINPMSASINVGTTLQMTATCRDQFGATMTCPTISWSSSNSAIASVNPLTGLVTTVTGVAAGGPVNITASGGGRSGNATVTVMAIVGTITFNVTSAGPLSGVAISVDGTPRGTTDESGILAVPNLTIGATHIYIATKSGYNTVSGSTYLDTTAKTVPISMTLTPPPIAISIVPNKTSCTPPCDVSIDITWRNDATTDTIFVPSMKVNNVPISPAQYPSQILGPNDSVTKTFIISGLTNGTYNMCPDPS